MEIKGKHIVEEIKGTRCSVLEKACDGPTASAISEMLEPNGYTVLVEENPKNPKLGDDAPVTFKVGVTDITFMLPVMLHLRKLKIPGSKQLLGQDYWMKKMTETA